MTMLTPIAAWSDVPQHETGTLVLGGAGAPMNTQAQALLNRTEWLLAGNVLGVQSIWVPASELYARSTNGAAAGTAETANSKIMLKTFDFDAATIEYVQFIRRMPKKWNLGTVAAAFTWSHPYATTNFGVAWGIQAAAISNGDSMDATLGTANYIYATGGAVDTAYTSLTTPAITIPGPPAAEDLVVFQIFRNVGDMEDSLGVDARLHGVTIYFTIAAGTDA